MRPLVFAHVACPVPGLERLSEKARREAEVIHEALQARVEDGIDQGDFESMCDALKGLEDFDSFDFSALREALRAVIPLYLDDLTIIAANQMVMIFGERPEPDPHGQLRRLLDLPAESEVPSQADLAQTLFEQYYEYASRSHEVGDEAVALMAARLQTRRTHSDTPGFASGFDPTVKDTLTDVLLRPENLKRLGSYALTELTRVQREGLPPSEREEWNRLQRVLSAAADASGMRAFALDTDHDGRLGADDTVVVVKYRPGQPALTVPLGDANLLWFLAQ